MSMASLIVIESAVITLFISKFFASTIFIVNVSVVSLEMGVLMPDLMLKTISVRTGSPPAPKALLIYKR
jgi:general stress protein CsbA